MIGRSVIGQRRRRSWQKQGTVERRGEGRETVDRSVSGRGSVGLMHEREASRNRGVRSHALAAVSRAKRQETRGKRCWCRARDRHTRERDEVRRGGKSVISSTMTQKSEKREQNRFFPHSCLPFLHQNARPTSSPKPGCLSVFLSLSLSPPPLPLERTIRFRILSHCLSGRLLGYVCVCVWVRVLVEKAR